ncbi:MAG TPA: 50S ribosomal protein L3 [Candidatus Hydrogenedentes bacterium]|nr:50S ribosomal protein L3 [Candidatus Hydrogenedentota bacterium]HPG69445.1 50S ribosomal protein L3 [Candidatus Hydrogenedentota bacterium]
MVKGMLGKKLGMTRIFAEDGCWIEVTLLEAGPCTVVQRKTRETDGYDAVQIGFGDVKEGRCTKPLRGHFARAGLSPKRYLREFRVADDSELKPGDEVRVDIFRVGDHVDVSGTSKGKGFAGVIKRHKFQGGPGTHGSNFHRAPGSIGQSADPSKVIKGKRLPGRMGNQRITTQNLEVVKVDADKNLIVVRGCVPGANGGMVVVRESVKKTKGAK